MVLFVVLNPFFLIFNEPIGYPPPSVSRTFTTALDLIGSRLELDNLPLSIDVLFHGHGSTPGEYTQAPRMARWAPGSAYVI
jgi:hypothetical protein